MDAQKLQDDENAMAMEQVRKRRADRSPQLDPRKMTKEDWIDFLGGDGPSAAGAPTSSASTEPTSAPSTSSTTRPSSGN